MVLHKDLIKQLSPETKIFHRDGSKEYIIHSYQYSTTSHRQGDMSPAAVIYPVLVEDIICIVKYAGKHDIG